VSKEYLLNWQIINMRISLSTFVLCCIIIGVGVSCWFVHCEMRRLSSEQADLLKNQKLNLKELDAKVQDQQIQIRRNELKIENLEMESVDAEIVFESQGR